MSPVHLRSLEIPRNQPEDRESLCRTRRPREGHLGHNSGCQDTELNHTSSAIHLPIQKKPQTRGLKGYGSSSSAPPTPQRSFPSKHGKQEVQPRIPLGRTWSKFPEDMSQKDILQRPYGNHQRMESHQAVQTSQGEDNQDKGESSHYSSYSRTAEPDRAYSDSFRLKSSRPTHLSSGFIPFRHQNISGQESQFFTIPCSFQEKTRIQGEKQDIFQAKAEIVRPNDPEAVGLGERSTQESEIVVNTSRISSPNNGSITPTQNEQSVVTPEINLNSDALWLQMSQFSEKTQKQFAELQGSHVKMEKLPASMDKIVKTLQEGHSQPIKASEETNRRLTKVLEEQHHCKRERNCLDQE
ncbi:hypothetical protein O181_010450 [Austropuccinia psidii MF-1]|uniref:Uncharacterized protein n=1 Tax=Austropuccinia psidii MF-1 TaxID=1389203 RepID=A0A9Q3BT85_9BASI|nr:hypothetical protein [Austropuccinia psidii MF-1]